MTIKPTRAYILCATPRSGSTLLCDLLSATGVAGRPDSFFRRESRRWWADFFKVPTKNWRNEDEFDQDYLTAVLQYGSNGTSVFGMRLMWESLAALSSRLDWFYPDLADDHARLTSAFGQPRYIHLSREDKVEQAVSHLKAEQSGLWHAYADGTERERLSPARAPAYDGNALTRLLAETEAHDAAWNDWFEQHDIQPLRVTYEALAVNPQTQLGRILSALGLDASIADSVKPKSAKLADDHSREWAARFRSERIR